MFGVLKILMVLGCLMGGMALAQTTPEPQANPVADLAEKLTQLQAQVDQLKSQWDRAKLETTLYEQRDQRAYKRWVKAVHKLKAQALTSKQKADLELMISIEKRKLAFSKWQWAQFQEVSQEAQIKSLNQDQETKAIEAKIRELESQLPH